MICGIGTDIVLIQRITVLMNRFSDRLAIKILAKVELDDYYNAQNKSKFLAKRFAAKEALAKSFGTGIKGFWFTDIIITHDNNGKPIIKTIGHCLKLQQKLKITNIHLSITDEKNYAVAFVVTEY